MQSVHSTASCPSETIWNPKHNEHQGLTKVDCDAGYYKGLVKLNDLS